MCCTLSELNKRNALRVGFSPGTSYSPLAVMNTDGPDEGGKLWHLVSQINLYASFLIGNTIVRLGHSPRAPFLQFFFLSC